MTNPAVEKFYESIQGIGERAQRGVEAIEMEISRQEEQLRQLKAALADAQRILYTIDPDKKPKPKQRGRAKSSNGLYVSGEKIEALRAWLTFNVGDTETFSAPEIMASESFDLMSEPTLRAALHQLHEHGEITLDSLGGPQSKRRKNYKRVVA